MSSFQHLPRTRRKGWNKRQFNSHYFSHKSIGIREYRRNRKAKSTRVNGYIYNEYTSKVFHNICKSFQKIHFAHKINKKKSYKYMSYLILLSNYKKFVFLEIFKLISSHLLYLSLLKILINPFTKYFNIDNRYTFLMTFFLFASIHKIKFLQN